MAYGKIEPTGCSVHKGKIQLRFSFYLEPSDPRYIEHHVKVDGVIRDNPFHNHFVYVDADMPDAEIEQLLAESLEEFFGIWAEGEDIRKAWRERPLKSKRLFQAGSLSGDNIKKCQNRVKAIISGADRFKAVRNG